MEKLTLSLENNFFCRWVIRSKVFDQLSTEIRSSGHLTEKAKKTKERLRFLKAVLKMFVFSSGTTVYFNYIVTWIVLCSIFHHSWGILYCNDFKDKSITL